MPFSRRSHSVQRLGAHPTQGAAKDPAGSAHAKRADGGPAVEMDPQHGAFLTPSLFHGGAQRIDDAKSILQQLEREQEEAQRRRLFAEQQLVDAVRDELEDSVAALQRRHSEVLDYVRRCSVAANNFSHFAFDRLQVCLAEIEAVRAALDRKEETLRMVVNECLETRLSLLDEQMRTFAIAAPETEELIRRVQTFVEQADAGQVITGSKPLIDEIERQTERIKKLPSPADEMPFEHIVLTNVAEARHAVNALSVHESPSVYYIVPSTGHVCGGTTVRVEGSALAGDDVKVFVGGILCDHVAVRSPQGGSSITCVTPPCQGDLKVDVIVEVDGSRASGGTTFQYHTPAPRVQQTDVVLLRTHAGHLLVPVNGEGFARVPGLNQIELRAQDQSGNDMGVQLSYEIAEIDEQRIVCLVPKAELPAGNFRILASVAVAGVSSGRPMMVGHVSDEMMPVYSSRRSAASPGRRELEEDYILQSQFPVPTPSHQQPREFLNTTSPQPQAVSNRHAQDSPTRPVSRVIKAENSLIPRHGRQHRAFYIERQNFVWGAVGVAVFVADAAQDIFQWYSQRTRGWLYHSDGRCTNTISGESIDTGVSWGENCNVGVTACFESGTITFYKDNSVVHIFGSLREPCHVFLELGGSRSRGREVPFSPPAGAVPISSRVGAVDVPVSGISRCVRCVQTLRRVDDMTMSALCERNTQLQVEHAGFDSLC